MFALPGFTATDLLINQRGELSPVQRTRLRRDIIEGIIVCTGMSLWIVALFVLIILLVDGSGNLVFWVLVTISFMTMITLINLKMWNFVPKGRSDLRTGKVLNVTGVVEQSTIYGGRGSFSYYLKVNTLDFEVPRPVYEAVSAGMVHQIFYTPSAKMVVSVLRPDDDDRSSSEILAAHQPDTGSKLYKNGQPPMR
ncbi:MAG TPA: hypothetical protein VHL11_23505 [Phototrophicaceae bacterium]|nr:hypothetical protein [Phototrophicaceae bacterium]